MRPPLERFWKEIAHAVPRRLCSLSTLRSRKCHISSSTTTCHSGHATAPHGGTRRYRHRQRGDGMYDVVVVGGGAAGTFAAIEAARRGSTVLCLEATSRPLKKVSVSGGGRCNVMHDPNSWDPDGGSTHNHTLVRSRYPRGALELLGSLSTRFSPVDTAAWFEAEGVELKCEDDGRVFPTTDRSETVVDALLEAARRAGVHLKLGSKVLQTKQTDGGGFEITYSDRDKGRATTVVRSTSLVLATGSASHGLAKSLGHLVSALIPSLFSFRLDGPGAILDGSLAGVSLVDVELGFTRPASEGNTTTDGGTVTSRGPLIVTHNGISGPAALRLSSFAAVELAAARYRGEILFNLMPGVTPAELTTTIQNFREHGGSRKQVATMNPFGLPRRVWAAVLAGRPLQRRGGDSRSTLVTPLDPNGRGALRGVDLAKPWGYVSKLDTIAIVARMRASKLPFSGKDSNKEEFVTAGGVCWSGIYPHTMESRQVDGLYFAGEIVDIDGITGGHNFQSCWTTGYVAGANAAACAPAEMSKQVV